MAKRKSRLERLEQKKATRSAFLYLILSIVVIGLLLKYGITGVSKFAGFVLNIAGTENSQIQEETNSFIAPPRISFLPEFINKNEVNVNGTASPGKNVYVYVNESKKEVLTDAQGEFNAKLTLFQNVPNEIYAVVEEKGSISPKSNLYTVVVDTEEPKLEIISPGEGSSYYGENNRQVKIEGQSEATAKVTVNERVAIVRSDGKFDYLIRLENGENVFKIKAVDEAGNETELEYKLHFNS